MQPGNFYFLSDQYFLDFPDDQLMQNREIADGKVHDRPCFYAFQDNKTDLFWMIPFSSRVEKYRRIYDKKVEKYGFCNTIMLGEVLGYEKAFLIQNMCPTKEKYIVAEYIDWLSEKPVHISDRFSKTLVKNARKVLDLHRRGHHLIFPDVLLIERMLCK